MITLVVRFGKKMSGAEVGTRNFRSCNSLVVVVVLITWLSVMVISLIWCSHGKAPTFVYNKYISKYGSLSGYWPCMAAVWSFLDRNLPQKASQISSPLFQQINTYHPMLRLFAQSLFTWGPSFIPCEFFEIFPPASSGPHNFTLPFGVANYQIQWVSIW
jgi:hypothetical protein